jgi:hypothetical protein
VSNQAGRIHKSLELWKGYNISLQELYQNTCRYLLPRVYLQHFIPQAGRVRLVRGLPSWVPDSTSLTDDQPFNVSLLTDPKTANYHASRQHNAQICTNLGDLDLTGVAGTQVDVISHPYSIMDAQILNENSRAHFFQHQELHSRIQQILQLCAGPPGRALWIRRASCTSPVEDPDRRLGFVERPAPAVYGDYFRKRMRVWSGAIEREERRKS